MPSDPMRLFVGSLGLATSWFSLEKGAVLAALLASLATAAFMGLSALEKWDERKARKAKDATSSP